MSTSWRTAGQPSVRFAQIIDATPVVSDQAARDALFPTPTTNQRVHRLDTGALEQWNGSAWVLVWNVIQSGLATGIGAAADVAGVLASSATRGLAIDGHLLVSGSHLYYQEVHLLNYYQVDAGSPAGIFISNVRGSKGSEAGTQSGDMLGRFTMSGWAPGAAANPAWGGQIRMYAKETWGATAHGAYWSIRTKTTGTATMAERCQIDDKGITIVAGHKLRAARTTDSALYGDVPGVIANQYLLVQGDSDPAGYPVVVAAIAHSGTATHAPALVLWRSRGTAGSESAVQSGDVLGSFYGAGRTSVGWSGSPGEIEFVAAENFTGVAQGGRINIYTITPATTTRVKRVTIDNVGITILSGALLFSGTVAGAGDIRLTSTGTIMARNSGNDGDNRIVSMSGDEIGIGGTPGGDAPIVVDAANDYIGVFGASPVAKPTVTGSRAGNAALASLLTALATIGWLTDSTS